MHGVIPLNGTAQYGRARAVVETSGGKQIGQEEANAKLGTKSAWTAGVN